GRGEELAAEWSWVFSCFPGRKKKNPPLGRGFSKIGPPPRVSGASPATTMVQLRLSTARSQGRSFGTWVKGQRASCPRRQHDRRRSSGRALRDSALWHVNGVGQSARHERRRTAAPADHRSGV